MDTARISKLMHCHRLVAKDTGGAGHDSASVGSLRENCIRRASVIDKLGQDSRRLLEIHWTIPEYHDEQRLRDGPVPANPSSPGQTTFGPVAFVYAVPQLMSYQYFHEIENQGPRGALVAYVVIDDNSASPLPQSYQRLQLQKGVNCVWLARTPGVPANQGWRAYIEPATMPDTVCDRDAPLPQTSLEVARESPLNDIDDYPPVARFAEGTLQAHVQPSIIVKCLAGTCEIGPHTFTPSALPPPAAFAVLSPNKRERRIKGWHDDQWLSERSSGVYRPVVRAVVTPRPNAARMTGPHFANPVDVATIYLFADPPAGSRYANWGLRSGLNTLSAHRGANGIWRARLRSANGITFGPWTIDRTPHHDEAVPGTARFRWSESPTGIWFPCDEACCQGQGT